MPTTIRSFSKINLGLAIGPVRADGFHGLTTLYQTIEAHDLVTISAERLGSGTANRITITSDHQRVPLDERNTVWKMLERALSCSPFADQAPGSEITGWAVSVHIEKRLPVQGGLGAGSANAAAALVALEQETGLRVPGEQKLRIAAEVGSDVPLFLIGGAVLGLGRGEQVYPMPDLVLMPDFDNSAVEVVLALPQTGVSTPQAFRDWDQLVIERSAVGVAGPPALTATASSRRLEELSRALAAALCEPQTSSGVFASHEQEDLARQPLAALVRTGIRNDFEEVVFRQHPLLGTIKCALLGVQAEIAGEAAGLSTSAHALYAALSGSGSALFGLYGNNRAAEEAEARLAAMGVRTLRTRLLSRAAYWARMAVQDAGQAAGELVAD